MVNETRFGTRLAAAAIAATCMSVLLSAGPAGAATKTPGAASLRAVRLDGAAAGTRSPKDAFPWFIRSTASDLCLQPLNGSSDLGVAIVQEPCDVKSPAQEWQRDVVSGVVVHYRNVLTGRCLDARGGATNGTPVQQWACNTISNENWELTEDEPDSGVELISRVSGTRSHCLDVPNAGQAPGLAMQIYGCNGTDAQRWFD